MFACLQVCAVAVSPSSALAVVRVRLAVRASVHFAVVSSSIRAAARTEQWHEREEKEEWRRWGERWTTSLQRRGGGAWLREQSDSALSNTHSDEPRTREERSDPAPLLYLFAEIFLCPLG